MCNAHFYLCMLYFLIFFTKDLTPKTIASDESTSIARAARQFFSPFLLGGVGIVRFENGVCTATGGTVGTCYRKRRCSDISGLATTSCASGIGVCCVITQTCGGSSQINNTYFISPGFPASNSDSSICSFIIEKIDSDICQVRLDFLTMRLSQPDANGTCTTDAFIVSGGASTVPILCGDNTGQHMYVDFNDDANIILTVSATSGSTAWNIRVAQINCACPTRAPSGCLQYYNTTSGTVRSFNYGATGFQNGTRQLINMNYGVCVAMINGYCSITWSQASGDYSFTVSGNTYTAVGDGTIATSAAELFGNDCTTDFVVIPAPIFTSNSTPSLTDRFCGNGFASVISYSKPFVLTVVTDNTDVNDTGNRGFALSFSQGRCATNTLLVG